jgi:DNA-binding NarL/FixJ family response regulator
VKNIKVLIVDNEEVFREGLAKLLKDQPHINVVYQCGSGAEAMKKSSETIPNVVLISSQLPDYDVLETIQKIKKSLPEVKVAIITRPGEGPNPLHALDAGASAYLNRAISADDLVKAIELILSGRTIISPLFAEEFLKEITSAEKAAEAKSGITEREIEIGRLIA